MKLSLSILAGLAGFVIVAGGARAQQVPAQKPVAVVNNEPITAAELAAVLKSTQPESTTPLTEAQKKELQTNAVNLLVEDILMRQYCAECAAAQPPGGRQGNSRADDCLGKGQAVFARLSQNERPD